MALLSHQGDDIGVVVAYWFTEHASVSSLDLPREDLSLGPDRSSPLCFQMSYANCQVDKVDKAAKKGSRL